VGYTQVLSYHDAWTTWGSSGATKVSEYESWARTDAEHGVTGQFMDDFNLCGGGNVAGTPAQYATLVEHIRGVVGGGVIELNIQFADIWHTGAGNCFYAPETQRALSFANVVDKEFNVDATSGIRSPGRYAEWIEYCEALRAKGIGTTLTGDGRYNAEADKEYSLASYLLVNSGLDFIGFHGQSPTSEYTGMRVNLGEQTVARAKLPSGLYTRVFSGGEAVVAPPGTSGTVTLPRAMTRLGTPGPVTSVTLTGGQGAVLQG
jgi:hypothetical protein